MLALETISVDNKVLITKGKKYIIGKENYNHRTRYYVIDDYGDRLYLTKDDILSKFKLSKKEYL